MTCVDGGNYNGVTIMHSLTIGTSFGGISRSIAIYPGALQPVGK